MPIGDSGDYPEVKVYNAEATQKSASKASWKKETHSHSPSTSSVAKNIFEGIYNAFMEKFFSSKGEYKERLHIKVGNKHALSNKYHRYDFACKSTPPPLESDNYQAIKINDGQTEKEVYVSVPSVAKRLNIPLEKARKLLKEGGLEAAVEEKYEDYKEAVWQLNRRVLMQGQMSNVRLDIRNGARPEKTQFNEEQMEAIKEKSKVYAKWMEGVLYARKSDLEEPALSEDNKKNIENICKEIAWGEANAKDLETYLKPLSNDSFQTSISSDHVYAMEVFFGDKSNDLGDKPNDLLDEMHNAYRIHQEEQKVNKMKII